MALELPSAAVTVKKGGIGVVQSGPTNVHVCIGPSSKGPLYQPVSCTLYTDAVDTFGCGPMPKAAAYAVRSTRARYIVIRIPAVTVAGSVSAVTGPSGTTSTATGTPTWGYDFLVVFTTGGTIGTTGMVFKVSRNGGVDFDAPANLLTNTTISVGGGITLNLTAGNVYSDNDQVVFWSKPASQYVKAADTTRVGSSTSSLAFSGTPMDEYDDIRWEVLTGGTRGTPGITYRYTLDGGNKWQGPFQLGVATSVLLMDGEESSGVTLSIGAGTLDTGDITVSATTGPAWQSSDVQTAITALRESNFTWRSMHLPVEATASKLGDVSSTVGALEAQGIFTYVVGAARDRVAGEVDAKGKPSANWRSRLIAEYVNFAGNRASIWAGRARILCPITGRSNRRPISWVTMARLVSKTVQVDPGRKKDGPLSGDVKIFNDAGLLVEHDSRVSSSLHEARFGTLRTFDRDPGVYITRGNVMASPSSAEFNRIAMRAVMDLACEIYAAVMIEQIGNDLLANPMTAAAKGENVVPGSVAEHVAVILDDELTSALRSVLVANGYVGDVRGRVSRTDPVLITGKLTAEVSVDPLAYVDHFEGSIAFANPALAVLTQ